MAKNEPFLTRQEIPEQALIQLPVTRFSIVIKPEL
jgi:hypothetical protein